MVQEVILVDPSESRRKAGIDSTTHSIQTIDYAHHEVHEGSAFHVSYSVTTASSDDDVTAIM